MTWVLVLIFYAGPVSDQVFMLGTYGKGVPDRFANQKACVKRIDEVGAKVEAGLGEYADFPHALECRKVKLGADV